MTPAARLALWSINRRSPTPLDESLDASLPSHACAEGEATQRQIKSNQIKPKQEKTTNHHTVLCPDRPGTKRDDNNNDCKSGAGKKKKEEKEKESCRLDDRAKGARRTSTTACLPPLCRLHRSLRLDLGEEKRGRAAGGARLVGIIEACQKYLNVYFASIRSC